MATASWRANTAGRNLIKRIVDDYKRDYPEDYRLVVEGIAMKREMTRDEFASVEGSPDMRGLFEIPEVLVQNLIIGLDESTTTWWKTKEGGRWFARTFREFSLPYSI